VIFVGDKMAQRFYNPVPEWIAHNVARLEGYKLFFYESGTSTPADTYKVAALTGGQENLNPVVFDEYGRPEFDIFLQNIDYKVILATPDASDDANDPPSGDEIVWTRDPVRASDFAAFPIFILNDGNPNGSVAGTAGSAGVQPTYCWDYTNEVLYVCTVSGDAATAVWTALNQASSVAVPPPQGRLTLTSGTPVLANSVTAGTAVYYTPYVGNLVPIYNGAATLATAFTELTLSLVAAHTANSIYDVFVFSNNGVLTVVTGPAWTTGTAGSGARGSGGGTTQLARVNGFWVNAVELSGRNGATTYTIDANKATYVGTILMDGTNGQCSCLVAAGQSRRWGVWNAYNRVSNILRVVDSTASWTYATATIRQSRADTGNVGVYVIGLAEENVEVDFQQTVGPDSNTDYASAPRIGIGVNSTTAFTGMSSRLAINTNTGSATGVGLLRASAIVLPALGRQDINSLERGSDIFYGSSADMLMTVKFQG
jgi:hypothetical protein